MRSCGSEEGPQGRGTTDSMTNWAFLIIVSVLVCLCTCYAADHDPAIDELIQQGRLHLESGKLDDATRAYASVLERSKKSVDKKMQALAILRLLEVLDTIVRNSPLENVEERLQTATDLLNTM